MKITTGDTFLKSLRKIHLSKNPFYIHFWTNLYSELKWIIWALRKYFKIVTTMRPWDYYHILEMMKFQIEILCELMEKKGMEIDETRIPKQDKMRKFIELAERHNKDDYAERCGMIYSDEDLEFVETEDSKNKPEKNKRYTIVENGIQSKEEKSKILDKSRKLEEDEWNEMIDLLKDARSWWD